MPNPDACWSCGAMGACFVGCHCRKCADPIAYNQWVRNQPGNYAGKAKADHENRVRLELNGQKTMVQETWNREKMFSALRDKLVLILERALEKIRSAKDGLTTLRLAVPFLREFAGLTGDLIEVTKDERWI